MIPTTAENWMNFQSSKLFSSIRKKLTSASEPERCPSFDQLVLCHCWGGKSVSNDTRQRDSLALEQMSPMSANKETFAVDKLLETRPDLERFVPFLFERYAAIMERKNAYTNCETTGDSSDFLSAARFGLKFGCVRDKERGGIVFRDWVTGDVDKVIVRGEFSKWEDCEMTIDEESLYGYHTWSYFVPDVNGVSQVEEGSKYQFKFVKCGEEQFRVPAYARHVHVDESNGNVDARVLTEDKSYHHTAEKPTALRPDTNVAPIVYECHIGTSTNSSERIGSFEEFRLSVLPRVILGGYNTICFMGISQHSSYSTFGWHVTSHYAPDISFGTPDDLHRLINECHLHGIRCWVSVVHSHCAPIAGGGLQNYMQWSDESYCPVGGAETTCKRFDAKKFALQRHEVLRYLLGSIVMWAEEYRVDGIRIENLHTMLFYHQGVGLDFGHLSLDKHFDHEADMAAHVYIALCSLLCRELNITATASTECESPLLTTNVEDGGLGLDYVFSTAAQKLVQQCVQAHDWTSSFSVEKLAEIARLQEYTGNNTILSASNWDSNIYARRPLKIALLSWETLYTHPVGGVAPHVTELAAGLARLGHEVHIFTRSTTAGANYSIHHGVHLHECPMQLNADFVQEIRNMCSSLRGHLLQTESYMNDNFAIIHAHDWLAGPGLEGLRELGRTTVQTIHSTEYGRCGNQIFGGQSKAVRDIEGASCDIADRVICVSGVLADEVKEFYHVHPEKIRVVYNGINAMSWDGFEDGASIKARYGISPMQPMLLFVGRMVIQKGPDLIVDALPEIVGFRNDVCIVMVGDGHMLDGLKARTDAMGYSNNIKWLGKKGGAELKSLFKACDAVLVPSRNEPFGIVVLEAWAAYKPVVATTCGGPRDFVSHDIEGYLVDPNPPSVAWGVKQILSNFEHTRWMGERGRVKAAFSFTWDRIATETRDVYLELINRQDTPYGIAPFRSKTGEQTLIAQLIGPLIACRMSVFDDCMEVQRGINYYNMIRLFITICSSTGHMSFMGTEFGQPDILDLPRPGNHFSKENARTSWDLSTTTDLKFKYMAFFMATINKLLQPYLTSPVQTINVDNDSHTIVVQKGPFSFVFNFGADSYEKFDIGHTLPSKDLHVVLCSAQEKFSGRSAYAIHETVVTNAIEVETPYMGCDDVYTIMLPAESVVIVADRATVPRDNIQEFETDQWVSLLVSKTRATLETSKPDVGGLRQESSGRLRERI